MLTEKQKKALDRIGHIEEIDKDPKGKLLELSDIEDKHYKENEVEHVEIHEDISKVDKRVDEIEQAIEDIELLEPQRGERGTKFIGRFELVSDLPEMDGTNVMKGDWALVASTGEIWYT
jgi:hypothetical protein